MDLNWFKQLFLYVPSFFYLVFLTSLIEKLNFLYYYHYDDGVGGDDAIVTTISYSFK